MDAPKPLDHANLGQPTIIPKSAEVVWVGVPEGTSETGSVASLAVVEPTQIRKPWRSAFRTAFAALVALAAMAPVLVQATGLDPSSLPWLAGVLGVAAAVTRVMATPAVEVFFRRFLPFLSATGTPYEKES